jgi:Citrate synthase, C-terminal domain/Protein of unknown function (DUF3017)
VHQAADRAQRTRPAVRATRGFVRRQQAVPHVRADGGDDIRGARPYPNVDMYAASVYHCCAIQMDPLTPVFLVSRMAGSTAHVMGHRADNRLIRPYRQDAGERGPQLGPAGGQMTPPEIPGSFRGYAPGSGAAANREEQAMSPPQPSRPSGVHRPDGSFSEAGGWRVRRGGHAGAGRANLPYVIVLAGVFGGLLWVWLSKTHVKGGILMFAGSLLLAAAARLVLADERAGLLVSRRRAIDVAAFAILGFGLLLAALLIPNPS